MVLGRFIHALAGNSGLCACSNPRSPVHPRACGEQIAEANRRNSRGGSSPRLRGTGDRWTRGEGGRRFIPAPAGNRKVTGFARTAISVHPRACGEQFPSLSSIGSPAGSSPRLRGTAVNLENPVHEIRFIPAPAGNRAIGADRFRRAAVHPRACGEQAYVYVPERTADGSSPRLRGTGAGRGRPGTRHRFIPAPAGNSFLEQAFCTHD